SARAEKITLPEVTWLWRFEEGTANWPKVMEEAAANDMVLTLSHYTGVEMEDSLNNQQNPEFFKRLSEDPRWEGPLRLEVGRFGPVEVDVFFKKGSHTVTGLSADGAGTNGQNRSPQ